MTTDIQRIVAVMEPRDAAGPKLAGWYVVCGMHWIAITDGYGCAWAHSADPEHATRYDSAVLAMAAIRKAGRADHGYVATYWEGHA